MLLGTWKRIWGRRTARQCLGFFEPFADAEESAHVADEEETDAHLVVDSGELKVLGDVGQFRSGDLVSREGKNVRTVNRTGQSTTRRVLARPPAFPPSSPGSNRVGLGSRLTFWRSR